MCHVCLHTSSYTLTCSHTPPALWKETHANPGNICLRKFLKVYTRARALARPPCNEGKPIHLATRRALCSLNFLFHPNSDLIFNSHTSLTLYSSYPHASNKSISLVYFFNIHQHIRKVFIPFFMLHSLLFFNSI